MVRVYLVDNGSYSGNHTAKCELCSRRHLGGAGTNNLRAVSARGDRLEGLSSFTASAGIRPVFAHPSSTTRPFSGLPFQGRLEWGNA